MKTNLMVTYPTENKHIKQKTDPKKIKSFLSIIKTVNTKELDRLEEIGVINNKDIEGCYTTKKHTPYFLVTKKESGD